jgi:hypothetical protein
MQDRVSRVLAAIDAANSADPTVVQAEGRLVPAERLYGERMSAALAEFMPNASEALTIAARGQHIERWTTPRANYPAGRRGYLAWRRDLKNFHARRLADIMAAHGFHGRAIDRVGALVRKERLKQDPEAQALEDVICIVFLKYYAGAFAVKHDDEKLTDILVKTWRKMSPRGHEAATGLKLPPRVGALLQAGLIKME